MSLDNHNDAILDAAMDLASRGIPILPVAAGTKVPLISDWPSKATTDAKEILAWVKTWPDCNIAALLGPRSGVIDLETDGPEAERALAELFGDEPPVPPTFASSRGR